jgi:hypothetical protein
MIRTRPMVAYLSHQRCSSRERIAVPAATSEQGGDAPRQLRCSFRDKHQDAPVGTGVNAISPIRQVGGLVGEKRHSGPLVIPLLIPLCLSIAE